MHRATPARRARFRQILPAILLLGVSFAPACTSSPHTTAAQAGAVPTAQEVFDRHAEAVGGRAHWNATAARTTRSTIRITGGYNQLGKPNDITGTMVVVRKAPDKLLSTTTLQDAVTVRQGFDGTVGWVAAPNSAPRRLTGSELAELKREAQFNAALDLRQAYPNAAVVGPFKIHDTMCWQVRLSATDSGSADAFYDQSTGLCVAISRRLLAGGQPMQVTRYLLDYKDYGGMLLPSRIEQSLGDNEQVELLVSVETAQVDDSIFAPPLSLPPR